MKEKKIIATIMSIFCIILFIPLAFANENKDNKQNKQNYDYDKVHAIKEYNKKMLMENNRLIAKGFNIDLDKYREIDRRNNDEKLFKDPKFIDLYINLDVKRGDTIPGIFLDEENNKIIILKQDINTINYMYGFEYLDDEWKMSDMKTCKGIRVIDRSNFDKYTKTTTETIIDGTTHRTISITE